MAAALTPMADLNFSRKRTSAMPRAQLACWKARRCALTGASTQVTSPALGVDVALGEHADPVSEPSKMRRGIPREGQLLDRGPERYSRPPPPRPPATPPIANSQMKRLKGPR